MAITDKQSEVSMFGVTMDVEFTWNTTEGLIEKHVVRGIDFADYNKTRDTIVAFMQGLGHTPYAPKQYSRGGTNDKMYIWLNEDGTRMLPCKDKQCEGRVFYVEGETKDKKPYQSLRCDKLTDFTDENKKKHTNWYNGNDHKLTVEIETGNMINTARGIQPEYVKVELPARGENQHDVAKQVYKGMSEGNPEIPF